MDRILNFRKLAAGMVNSNGQQIKQLYRSADISSASTNDVLTFHQLGIKHVIDLRSQTEISQQLVDDEISIINIDIIGNGDQNELTTYSTQQLESIIETLYRQKFTASDGFRQVLNYIEQLAGQPVLLHCTAGKDRTGIASAILMYLLGFSYEQIVDEYLTIDEVLVNALMNKGYKQCTENDIDVQIQDLRALAMVKRRYLDWYIEQIITEYGTIDDYIETKLAVNERIRASLQANYLEVGDND